MMNSRESPRTTVALTFLVVPVAILSSFGAGGLLYVGFPYHALAQLVGPWIGVATILLRRRKIGAALFAATGVMDMIIVLLIDGWHMLTLLFSIPFFAAAIVSFRFPALRGEPSA